MNDRYVLDAQGIHKSYTLGSRRVPVLQGVDLQVRQGEIVAVLGASGAGKSTLLHILGTLDRPSEGSLWIEGQDTGRMTDPELARLRNRSIGFVFQFHHLLAEFTALENVMMPGMVAGGARSRLEEHARALLARVGLEHRLDHKPGELSGGEQQRVAVARALAADPAVLLADEPTGNLDRANGEALADLLWELCRDGRQTLVIVTHNEQIAGRADRRVSLVDGILNENE